MLRPGDTVLLPTSENQIEHLWIVLTTPSESGKSVCVNITSYRNSFCDTTVVLEPGEHPFIVKRSIVRYGDARELDMNALETALNATLDIVCVRKEPCSPELLQKIIQGLFASKHTSKEILSLVTRK